MTDRIDLKRPHSLLVQRRQASRGNDRVVALATGWGAETGETVQRRLSPVESMHFLGEIFDAAFPGPLVVASATLPERPHPDTRAGEFVDGA